MLRTSRCRTRSRVVLLVATSTAAMLSRRAATADTLNYIGQNGTWSDPTVWSTGNLPNDGDIVNVISSGAAASTITFDGSSPSTFPASVTIDYTGNLGGSMSLLQTNGGLSPDSEYVGFNGVGYLNLSGGINAAGGSGSNGIYVGFSSGASGTITMGANSTLFNFGPLGFGQEYVGFSGSGTINQNGGSHYVGSLILAANSGSSGSYNLSDSAAYLSSGGLTSIGAAGNAIFTQTAGTFTTQNLTIGATGNGTFSLSGATALLNVAGDEIVADSGNALFTQTGGTHTAQTLSIGNSASGNGTFTLSSGSASFTTVSVGGSAYGGQAGHGVLSISGSGALNTAGSLAVYPGGAVVLAGGSLSVGSFNYNSLSPLQWTAGKLSITGTSALSLGTGTPLGNSANVNASQTLNVAASLIVPNASSLSLTGGTITAASLQLAAGPSALNWTSGSLNLTSTNSVIFDAGTSFGNSYKLGAGQSLSVTGPVIIGSTGTASFNQSAGQHAAGSLDLGAAAGAYGQYSLSNSASLTVANKVYVGDSGQGLLNQTGGTVTVNSGANAVYIGYAPGSSGTVNISGNSSVFNSSDVFVGNGGTGVFNQSSGLHALTGFLVLGGQADGGGSNSVGTYNLINGQLNANIVYAGLSGIGTFNQSAGSTIFGQVTAGYHAGSVGSINLSGNANLFDAGQVIVGDSGIGTMVQSGGSQLNAGITLGNSAGGSGTVRLSAGTITVDGETIVGGVSTGNFFQTGGTHAPSNLYLALQAGSSGTYTLNSGVLHPTSSTSGGFVFNGSEYIGYYGSATFNQTGGNHIVDNYMVLARAFGSSATYNLSGGTLSAPSESIGYQSSGNNVFNQTGGANTASAYLTVGDQGGAHGTYSLNGANAALTVNTLFDGWMGIGTFNQSAGTATIGSLFLAHESGANGSYNLSGGSLVATNSEDIGYHGTGTFNQTGGTHTVSGPAVVTLSSTSGGIGTYNLIAGTFSAGSVVNNGNINVSGGAATFAPLTGSGNTVLTGTNAAVTSLTVSSFAQNSISISGNALLNVLPNANVKFTNTANSLTISGSGLLNLANHDLRVNTPSNSNQIRQYLVAGYAGGNWNGAGGINSSSAANDATKSRALGYADGADGIVAGLAAGQTLVRSTIYGDADLSGRVTAADFNLLSAHFNQRNATWDIGDFDYNGRVTAADFNLLSAHFTQRVTAGSPNVASASASALTASPAANALELDVDPSTGDVKLVANSPTSILSYDLESSAANGNGDFIVANWKKITQPDANNAMLNNILASTSFDLNQSGAPGVPYQLTGTYDLGNILPAGLTAQQYLNDLTDAATGGTINGPSTYGLPSGSTVSLPVVVTTGVPEPTSLGLVGLAAVGLLGRRKRKVF